MPTNIRNGEDALGIYMPDFQSDKSKQVRTKEFDPKKTPLSGTEVFALVLPIVGPICSIALFFVVYAWVKPENAKLPEWVQWINLVFIIVMIIGAIKLSEVAAERILTRINSPLAKSRREP